MKGLKKMEKYHLERLSEIINLLKIVNQKLELIQKSIIINLKINSKLHGVNLNITSDEVDDSIFRDGQQQTDI